jgi:Crp-like helix-turn-helix domain
LLTHEYLAMMLGSRRSGVTIALATLQRAGYIRYAHGRITILDRPGLEETTCECYAVAQKQFTGFLRRVSGPMDATDQHPHGRFSTSKRRARYRVMNQSLKDDMEPDDRSPLGVPKPDENSDDTIRP